MIMRPLLQSVCIVAVGACQAGQQDYDPVPLENEARIILPQIQPAILFPDDVVTAPIIIPASAPLRASYATTSQKTGQQVQMPRRIRPQLTSPSTRLSGIRRQRNGDQRHHQHHHSPHHTSSCWLALLRRKPYINLPVISAGACTIN